MKRIIMMLTVAALFVVAMTVSAVPAFAVSPSQQQCEASGGTYTHTGGQAKCVTTTTSPKNPKFTRTTTTTGQGNLSNKQQKTSTCGGTGSGKCPPGQQVP
jgi:hypothetical protein